MTKPLLSGKKIIVTGASRGIGAAAARLFVREGATVALTARSADALEALAREINETADAEAARNEPAEGEAARNETGQSDPARNEPGRSEAARSEAGRNEAGRNEAGRNAAGPGATGGPRAFAVVADLGDAGAVERMVSAAVERLGGLDGAFNNAGAFERTTDLTDRTEAEFDDIVRVNLKGTWAAMAAEVRVMRAAGGGAIVNTSSISALRQYHLTPVYSATKRALDSLTESAAVGFGPDGIRVNGVAAGLTLTDMVEGWEEQQPGIKQAITGMIPLRRPASPEEIAEAAAWLLSDRASFVSGAVLPVTGGAHA